MLPLPCPHLKWLVERLLDADGDNHTDPGSGHVNNSDMFLQSGTETQRASLLVILHLRHTPHLEHRL